VELDIAPLRVIYGSLKRGEVTITDEFPVAPVTGDEITSQRGTRKQQPADQPTGDQPPAGSEAEWVADAQAGQ
jgi:hypothetical protein